jgi:predicted transcriptional regulator
MPRAKKYSQDKQRQERIAYLKAFLEHANLTVIEFADLARISKDVVYKFFAGRDIYLGNWERIERAIKLYGRGFHRAASTNQETQFLKNKST